MTPQERELLTAFLQQLSQAKADPKDPEAEALIREAVSRQPDSDYLLVQRAMGLDLALKAAQAQISKLQTELDAAPASAGSGSGTSFLGRSDAWGRSEAGDRKFARPAGAPAAQPSAWGSGLLSNLATTAAGVVAGSFLYQGIQNLMGHHPGSAASELANVDPNETPSDDDIAQAPDNPDDDDLALDDGFDSDLG